jgi:hypothetical protein
MACSARVRHHRLSIPEAISVLLTITTTHVPANDLGFLLHKNPERTRAEPSFGTAQEPGS